MHASSYENLRKCLIRYLGPDFFTTKPRRVVDIGSNSINGSYRTLFVQSNIEYLGLDMVEGEGVDLVLADPYRYPVESGTVDVVLSGQMLEHCEYFWLAFEEMVRILAPDGYLLLIAPSAGPIHRYPVDCYRFYPDAYHALARLTHCRVVALWQDERGPWKDLVGVFTKSDQLVNNEIRRDDTVVTPGYTGELDPENERESGQLHYLQTLGAIQNAVCPRLYLEVGVKGGFSLALAKCETIAVDPVQDKNITPGNKLRFYQTTSDEFFELDAPAAITQAVDMAFIDGMHLFEFVLRDFMHIERYCLQTSVIVIDDIFPNTPAQAARTRSTRIWTGDVWKIIPCLREFRPDLTLVLLDTRPTGMLVILGLNPDSRVLWERYNPIVARFNSPAYEQPPAYVLERKDSRDPLSPQLFAALSRLSGLRDEQATRYSVQEILQQNCL